MKIWDQTNAAYNQGYKDAQKEYHGVTIDGLKSTIELLELLHSQKDARIKELERDLLFADEQSKKLEALLEPYIKWEGVDW